MKIGKLPNEDLEKLILNKINNKRTEAVLRPGIGEDCCALDLGKEFCVLSSDPITGAANEIGTLAVHVSLNDIASCGALPIGIISTILMPVDSCHDDVEIIFKQISKTCDCMNVDVLGGHTEVTDAVNRAVVITTAIGKSINKKLISTGGAKTGDSILVTKHVGTEGAAILANDCYNQLKGILSEEIIEKARNLIKDISVVEEGLTAAEIGVTSMHDITEGGILGAIWECCKASKKGCIIHSDKIPVLCEVIEICNHFNIDPLKLISSGSMLITCVPENEEKIILALNGKNIKCTCIGYITDDVICVMDKEGNKEIINQPVSDELYKKSCLQP